MSKDFWAEKYRLKDKDENFESPSDKYSLTIQYFGTGPGTWNVSKGIARKGSKIVAEVNRNHSCFWYEWVEDHPNGNDYLLCGEDYQGQTIINLTEERVINYLPEEAKNGFGFCWINVDGSEKTKLIVEGCIWAAPYEIIEYDFSDPENPPFAILSRKYDDGDWDEEDDD